MNFSSGFTPPELCNQFEAWTHSQDLVKTMGVGSDEPIMETLGLGPWGKHVAKHVKVE